LSGTVGIFHRKGTPIDEALLRAMTDSLAYRGPDGLESWKENSIGLGHAMLRTTEEGLIDQQPAHLDTYWITADVRLDARTELTTQLEKTGQRIERPIPDSMLILHAYAAWGPGCVEYLRGDFSFGIWDAAAKILFCARDHFGIKPCYYAELGDLFLFSNTLDCLRKHPSVTKDLNESAIGDFLLFGLNYDKATTSFRDIQRLPPAHSLLISRESLQTRCYWRPPTEGRIRYARAEDYVDRFNELLKLAVADRLRSDRVGILLSGGLDSGAVAAVAGELSRSQGGIPDLYSYTVGYDSLIPDHEGVHARTMAKYLGIPNRYLPLDHVELFEKWDDTTYRFPEPVDNPLSAGFFEEFRMIASDCRVALSGEGADNLMYFQMWPYIKDLRLSGQWSRMLAEMAWFICIRPFPWLGVARWLQSVFGKISRRTQFPKWIAPEFARRAGLEARWRTSDSLVLPPERHLARPKAHASMLLPHWTNMFELQDPGVTHCNLEVRYPFLDLRMVDYLLAIPAFPWLFKKKLARKAMVGRLPETLRLRPKTPLSVDPISRKLRDCGNEWMNQTRLDGQISDFVSPPMIGPFCDRIGRAQFRPYCLDLWLGGVR
jgi:asparagine synthase (glutamine-hydrolysing)